MSGRRQIPAQSYLVFYALFAAVLFLIHSPFLTLPYFWDELGHFIPSALDLLRTGAWIPHSVAPNAHPPGVIAFLAAVWSVAGYSIAATRAAMLLVAAGALLAAFLLAIRLSDSMRGAPAFAVATLLVISPLFYAQSLLAQLDVPAMLFTCLALLMFLQDRPVASAAACTALVLVRETGLIVALVLAGWLLAEKRYREAIYFLAPAATLAAWLWELHRATGYWLGDREFARYNVFYPLHPVRAAIALLRRLYYLFVQDLHWVGTLAIIAAWRRRETFRRREWRIAGSLVGAHVLVFGISGGAVLERYLLPVLPLVYIAMTAGFAVLQRRRRLLGQAILAAGLLAANFWNPPYPFPLENNIAFADFVKLQKSAAEFLEFHYPQGPILTAWPLDVALARPEFGYVQRRLQVETLPDFRPTTLAQVDWSRASVFVLYSRGWSPPANLLDLPPVRRFWHRFYGYEPEMRELPRQAAAALEQVGHWEQRGLWVDVYAAPQLARPPFLTAMRK